jgi:4-hydroxy-tetrahydrodipicolinate synthase
MLKEEDLYGIYVPVITPFFQSGEVDYPSFRGHIIGLKDSSGGLKLMTELTKLSSKPILCGEDEFFYSMLCNGSKGGMLASANLQTEKFVRLYKSFMDGDTDQAKRIFDELMPLIRLLFRESNPAPIKWLLARQGVIESDTLRLPMTSISYSLQQEMDHFQ